jgi:hypothetical protein
MQNAAEPYGSGSLLVFDTSALRIVLAKSS